MARELGDYGAFMENFILQPSSSSPQLPLSGLTFAIKDIFDVEGYVTGFGNPDWAKTHAAATSTAPTVLDVLSAGATSIGKTVMDEMAYSINGENIHYGTPTNPCAADRVPGGSSSGSAAAVGAKLVDFSLGTDTGGSVRVPASYCNILGFRPSHGIVSTTGVIPMAQSFDTVGWFARDPQILKKVGKVLLHLEDLVPSIPDKVIIAEDCFELLTVPSHRLTNTLVNAVEKLYGGKGDVGLSVYNSSLDEEYKALFSSCGAIKYATLGEYVESKVPSLKHFMLQGFVSHDFNIPSLVALSSAMRLQQRYEFKNNHGEWITRVQPNLGPGISERAWEAVRATKDDHIDSFHSVRDELRDALSALLGDSGILVVPTVPGPPPKLRTEPSTLEVFRAKAFSLLSIAGVSGFCQVSIPLGLYENLPIAVSLIAKHGSDGFLLNVVEVLYDTLMEQVSNAENATS